MSPRPLASYCGAAKHLKPGHYLLHGPPHQLVMLRSQTLEGSPAHPLGLVTLAVENARLPAQSSSQPVRASRCPVARIFARAGVGKLIAVPAGEDGPAIEDRHAPAAAECRANKPGP